MLQVSGSAERAKLARALKLSVKSKGPELVKMGGAVFQFIISDAGPEGKFVLDLKNGSGAAKAGEEAGADCTITMADADLVAMAEGKLNGMQAFMGGKLKIKGNMMLAQKLQSILEAANCNMKSQALFDAMSAAVKSKGPELVKMGGAVFQFIISDAGPEGKFGKFVLDLKNGSGAAKAGEEAGADCTITMADADLVAMAEGKLDGMQAFMAVKSKGPELVKMGGAVFQFIISDAGPEGKFVLDLKNGSGAAKAGEEAGAELSTRRAPLRESMRFVDLNGIWSFAWRPSIHLGPRGFEKPEFDDGAWGGMPVPGNWELNGYGFPIYTNVDYIFHSDPPNIRYRGDDPEYNPTGFYRKSFEVPSFWLQGDYQIFVHLGAVCCTCHAFLNGQALGFSTDSKLPVEFDITSHLRWWFAGITRDVYVYARPTQHIRDIEVRAGSDGKLEVEVDMACGGFATRSEALQCKLLDASGTVLQFSLPLTPRGTTAAVGHCAVTLPEPKLWSAEAPFLYKLVVVLGGEPSATEAASQSASMLASAASRFVRADCYSTADA
eukprot:s423_g22.t2